MPLSKEKMREYQKNRRKKGTCKPDVNPPEIQQSPDLGTQIADLTRRVENVEAAVHQIQSREAVVPLVRGATERGKNYHVDSRSLFERVMAEKNRRIGE